MPTVHRKAIKGDQPPDRKPLNENLPPEPDALAPDRADAQKSWMHARGTDKLLQAVRDADDRAKPPAQSISERAGPS